MYACMVRAGYGGFVIDISAHNRCAEISSGNQFLPAFLSLFSALFSFRVFAGFFLSSFRASCPFAIAVGFYCLFKIKKKKKSNIPIPSRVTGSEPARTPLRSGLSLLRAVCSEPMLSSLYSSRKRPAHKPPLMEHWFMVPACCSPIIINA
jgi:hypothetical protein